MYKICERCSFRNTDSATFCVNCGSPFQEAVSANPQKCPECGLANSPGNKFCGGCGSRLEGEKKPGVIGSQWQRMEGDFAAVLQDFDSNRIRQAGVIVEQGTRALLFKNGKFVDELAPGHHTVGGESLLSQILGGPSLAKVLLIDSGLSPVKFSVQGVKTKDPIFVNVECEAGIKLDDPDLFQLNLFKGRRSLGLPEMAAIFEDEVREALQEEFSSLSVRELNISREYKGRIEQLMERALGQSLRHYGLRLQNLRTMSVSHVEYDEIAKKQEEYQIAVWEKESDLTGRKKLFEVKSEEDLQDIFETTRGAEMEEQRLVAISRLRKAVNTGKMEEARSDEEMAAFLDEIGKQKLLRTEEFDEFKRIVNEKKLDHEGARNHLLGKLDIERSLELRRLSLVGTQDIDADMVKRDLALERVRLESKLAQDQLGAASAREERQKDALARLEMELKTAQTQQQKEFLTLEVERAKADLGQSILERQRASKLADKKTEDLHEADMADRKAAREAADADKEVERKIRLMEAMSKASSEAVIALSDGDKASVLADLKKTEMFGSWTDEQILAAAAKDSPEVAKVFQEKYKSASSEEVKALYERFLEDQKGVRQDMKEVVLESIRSGQSGANVVYAPLGGAPLNMTGAAGPFCSNCRGKLSPADTFCGACGHKV